ARTDVPGLQADCAVQPPILGTHSDGQRRQRSLTSVGNLENMIPHGIDSEHSPVNSSPRLNELVFFRSERRRSAQDFGPFLLPVLFSSIGTIRPQPFFEIISYFFFRIQFNFKDRVVTRAIAGLDIYARAIVK